MWFNKPEAPITISAEYSDSDFIKFIIKELRERHFEIVKYFSGYKSEDNQITSCDD